MFILPVLYNLRVLKTPLRFSALTSVPGLPLLALVAANLFPLIGVLTLGWDVRQIMLLYWAENVVVALWSIVRMFVVGKFAAIPITVFFCFHFGMFMFVHLGFVLVLTAPEGDMTVPSSALTPRAVAALFLADMQWAGILALVASHGISFFRNFLGEREWAGSTLKKEMIRPYPRMVIMHIALIAGAFLLVTIGQPVGLLMVFVVLKIGFDASAHIAEHSADSEQ